MDIKIEQTERAAVRSSLTIVLISSSSQDASSLKSCVQFGCNANCLDIENKLNRWVAIWLSILSSQTNPIQFKVRKHLSPTKEKEVDGSGRLFDL